MATIKYDLIEDKKNEDGLKMSELESVPDFDPIFLAAKNPHPLDETIRFKEDTHTYWVSFVTGQFMTEHVLSISGFLKSYFPHFDADKVLAGMRKKNTKYAGMTNQQIKALWEKNGKTASEIGTRFHFLLECYFNGMSLEKYRKYRVIQYFFDWKHQHVDALGLVPFRTEQRMRTGINLRLTGTADALFVCPKQDFSTGVLNLVMYDWKFSKEIKRDNRYQNGHGVCSDLDNCNYNHYLLQQNCYKWILEKFYTNWKFDGKIWPRVRVTKMALVVLHDTNPSALHIELPNIQNLVEKMMEERKVKLEALCNNNGGAGEENVETATVNRKRDRSETCTYFKPEEPIPQVSDIVEEEELDEDIVPV